MSTIAAQALEGSQGPDDRPQRYVPEWTIADKIRKVRRHAGLTQAEFAAAMRIGKSQLQAWESEHSRPSYQSVMLLAMMCEYLYGVPVDWTMEGDERATPESLDFARHVGSQMSGEDLVRHEESATPTHREVVIRPTPTDGEVITPRNTTWATVLPFRARLPHAPSSPAQRPAPGAEPWRSQRDDHRAVEVGAASPADR